MPRRRFARNKMVPMLSVSISAGFFTGLGILLALFSVGLSAMEATVFATLSGFTLGAFFYRERSLALENEISREEQGAEVARLEAQVEYYYRSALVCLVYFDAGSLLVDRVSPGFLRLFGMPGDLEVRGKSIVELLRVSATHFEAIVGEAQRSGENVKTHVIFPEDADGNQMRAEVTAKYYRFAHMVEMAFYVSPGESREDREEAEIARKDFDRFRRGMYQRETRILELKEEVNQILKETGREVRYKFNKQGESVLLPGGEKITGKVET